MPARRRTAENRDPAGLTARAGSGHASRTQFARRLGGSDAFQSHAHNGPGTGAAGRLWRQLHSLWRARARDGGVIPYGGTFLAFSDYSRPAIRLAALMGLRVIHVMTHDSIGLGEDGPTHQPVEHLASLRAIPGLLVFRPADAIETAQAWDCAPNARRQPSILCLSRQALPVLDRSFAAQNQVGRGAYVVTEPARARDVTLIATGSEVAIAVDAAEQLGRRDIAAVVSAPCFELFAAQDADYRAEVLGQAPRVGVEAAVEGAWSRWLGDGGEFVGMTGFGASAPAGELYSQFGITAEAVAAAAERVMARVKAQPSPAVA